MENEAGLAAGALAAGEREDTRCHRDQPYVTAVPDNWNMPVVRVVASAQPCPSVNLVNCDVKNQSCAECPHYGD
ncbi:MAG: hypothetical protein AAF412_02970 [Pseudomonadota bacterium]